jgi:hypothetical protein
LTPVSDEYIGVDDEGGPLFGVRRDGLKEWNNGTGIWSGIVSLRVLVELNVFPKRFQRAIEVQRAVASWTDQSGCSSGLS